MASYFSIPAGHNSKPNTSLGCFTFLFPVCEWKASEKVHWLHNDINFSKDLESPSQLGEKTNKENTKITSRAEASMKPAKKIQSLIRIIILIELSF